jgi:hypothetical protein
MFWMLVGRATALASQMGVIDTMLMNEDSSHGKEIPTFPNKI